MKINKIVAATALAALFGFGSNAHAIPVSLELSLVIDVSGSVSTAEYNTQRLGYQSAFQNATVQSNIMSFAGDGGIAVNVIQFSTNAVQSIGWTQLDSVADINAFATAIGTMARASSGTVGTATDVEDGMLLGISSFANNGYEGSRLVIDVSGDGHQNTDPACSVSGPLYNQACAAVQTARNNAAAAGILINGLAIEGDYGTTGLTNWYNTNVRTANGFVYTATFDTFGTAVTDKIGSEIAGIPEPGALALLGIGLMGLAAARRRKTA